MYSPLIVEQRLFKAAAYGVKFRRRSVDESLAMSQNIERLTNARKPLSTEMKDFQKSEQVMCRFDFRYWAERYGFLTRDASEGGGVGPAHFWPSQERALALIASREEENEREFAKHGFAEGIQVVWHKTRQQGATGIARLITMHRMTLWKHTRCIAASLDETKVHELYDRDHIILDNLPRFLSPALEFDVKDSHIAFEGLRSRITYQQANQQAGVGTGQQFDVSHMTEIALWKMAERLQFDFFPAIPQAKTTFVGFESTANGRGDFWHEFTENVRKRVYGYGHWIYVFTPWYINAQKNRRTPPDDWTPNAITQEHAELIDATSAEFAGEKVNLKREQLYWWETEYELNKKQGSLHIFLTNYPATPEQSFQHHQRAALPLETVEWMRTTAKYPGMPYHLEVNQNAVADFK